MAEIPGISGKSAEKPKVYHREAILKKEGKTWTEYYAVLIGNSLVFNRKDEKTGRTIPHNITMIEINQKTQCGFSENKTCYRFPFWIQNGKAKYQFKCETKQHRLKWLNVIRLCAAGKPPEALQKVNNTNQRVQNKTNASNNKKTGASTATTKNAKSVSAATTDNVINTANRTRSKTVDDELKSSSVENKLSTSNGFKMVHRSKSFDSPPRNHKQSHSNHSISSKTLSSNKLKMVDNNINSNKPAKNKNNNNSKNNSSKPRSKTTTEVDFEDTVLENQHVKDSMSDIRPSTLALDVSSTSCQGNKNDGEDLTPTNEFYRCISCKESFSKEHMYRKKMEGDHHSNSNKEGRNVSPDFFEYELDGKGEKFENKVDLPPESIDMDEPERSFYPVDGKTPVENDELESYTIEMKYRSDGHIETFTVPMVTSKFSGKTNMRNNASGTVSVDRFGKIHQVSPNATPTPVSNPSSRRTSLQNRKSHLFIQVERAQSWTSLQGRFFKDPEPQRRENSAPSLRFSRHKLDHNQ